jgi:hypothetical protein
MSCDKRCGSDEEMACHDCSGADSEPRTSDIMVAGNSASDNMTKVETVRLCALRNQCTDFSNGECKWSDLRSL